MTRRTLKWTVALVSVAMALAVAEGSLRFLLFGTSLPLAAKEPAFYARTLDELWIYRYLFANHRGGTATLDQGRDGESRIRFYRDWAVSLQPDAQLGYARKADVRTPCHETTHLATRGLHEPAPSGPKIVFFGDSFVESAACSDDTLTTRIERLTGIDTLNHGVGGYGLDQIFIAYERIAPRYDRDDTLVLVGLIQNDLERVLLKVRSAPKPYFTLDTGAAGDERLTLHVDHIHPDALQDYFRRPPARSYLIDFVRGRLGHPVHADYLRASRDQRRAAVAGISRLLFERFATMARAHRYKLAFVLLPTPGAPFDDAIAAQIRAAGIPLIDLQQCLRASRRPDTDLYVELHPTPLGNDLLAGCLVRNLVARALVR